MKVLLIKTSSLGDVIHTFPAVTDAAEQIPGIQFDWVVEKAFADVPQWHPAVDRVIPISLRNWRKGWGKAWKSGAIQVFIKQLRQTEYDLIIDAQGLLLKSGIIGLFAHGPRAGYDRKSARDPWSALAYQHKYQVSRKLHAVERIRQLFAQALNYELGEDAEVNYGIRVGSESQQEEKKPYLVFLHSTTWVTKHWPEPYWVELASQAIASGYRVLWPWYTPDERLRAERLIAGSGGSLAPKGGLDSMAKLLSGADGVVGVDSGLAHLAAALERPSISLYGPTSTVLTGAVGPLQQNLSANYDCAPCLSRKCGKAAVPVRDLGPGSDNLPKEIYPPCFTTVNPQQVWSSLQQQMAPGSGHE